MIKKLMIAALMLISTKEMLALKIENNFVKDNYGNSIEIKEYNKLIVLDPAVVETIYLLNGEEKIVAIGKTAMSKIYPEEKTKDLESVGNISKPSLEKILSYTPDLVILNGMSTKTGETLKSLKIPYLINEAGNIQEILDNINAYGEILGKKEESKKLYEDSAAKLDELKEKIKNKPLGLKGTVLYSVSPMMGFNSKTLPGEVLELLGVENITNSLTGERPIISQEFLLKENPDFLAGAMSIKSVDDIKNSNPAIKEIKAGQKNNIFIVDSNKILRGSPRIFELILEFYDELLKVEK
ncbi:MULTISPECIES: ABC transporter substrate-binding protein [Fusobacterium]|jgi:iron complex transport system substrate-binding protein|uniref:Iron ABC transporter n=1 Tax=Fusobacterium varium ATCC 27725 TaxID=469618 RepID=A0ABM6U668_FUSVA|nr:MULTISPECIES: ABC transporter substrate-binding protein [Fusobacterium]AVQ31845.1 iron ABC transporter [Fusobacterium varium ATCC 27725]EES63200.1 putative flagellar protein FliS [Fusobacterium varium ATCC 27725]MDY4005669.1 ABC transporter substrate-binding protein [Fusobacterium varium]OFL86751.1 iron ABC transporter [Fusobacterium sp. HMSC073F01]VEH39313.1 Vitamin B12-binding protein precursor [Fusobacterium varium]